MRRIKLYTLSETETIQLYIKKNIERERERAQIKYTRVHLSGNFYYIHIFVLVCFLILWQYIEEFNKILVFYFILFFEK